MFSLSIIIPVYNVAPYIANCLRSVMEQSYDDSMECIVVDDCGKDDSIAIAERLINEYEGSIFFEIVHHDQNRGLSASRNTGLTHAKGEYIFFLDSDDEITEDCIEKMMAVVMKDPAVELVQGTYIYYHNRKQSRFPEVLKTKHAYTNEKVRACCFQQKQVTQAAWNKLIKRSLIQDNHLSFIEGLLFEDWPWTFNLMKHVKNAYFLPDVTYHYKSHPNSIMTGTNRETLEVHKLLGYHEIINHLTPGHEIEEVEFYGESYARLFLRHSYHMPELTKDLEIMRGHALKARNHSLSNLLGICHVFRNSKISGKYVYAILKRMRHPSQIFNDFSRSGRQINHKVTH